MNGYRRGKARRTFPSALVGQDVLELQACLTAGARVSLSVLLELVASQWRERISAQRNALTKYLEVGGPSRARRQL